MPGAFEKAEQYLLSLSNIPREEYMKNPRDCAVYLKRLQFFLDLLGNPEKSIPHYIHVTGTSGKGSVVNFLHSILTSAGKKVGSLSSPHPTYITERWKVRGSVMSKKEFASLVNQIRPVLDTYIQKTPYDMISYGELMTAMGLLYFKQKKVSWAILEVGCGGRYDATNVIPKKDVAVITNIGLDHVGLIGETKEEIAHEKAGIISKGARVFTAEKNTKILKVIQKACAKKGAALTRSPKHVISKPEYSLDGTTFSYGKKKYKTSSLGAHQVKNAALAIDVADAIGIPALHIHKGIAQAVQDVRMELVSKKPLIMVDTAHNPDKMKTTVQALREIHTKGIHLVVGFSENKQVQKMITQLCKLPLKSVSCTRNTINPFRRVADIHMLKRSFQKKMTRVPVSCFLDPKEALLFAKQKHKKDELILITGSTFLGGELRDHLKKS